jgi:uncharacterized membrane protein YadS
MAFEHSQGERNFAKRSTVLACYSVYLLTALFGIVTAVYKYLHEVHPRMGIYVGLITYPIALVFFASSLAGTIKSGPPIERTFQTRLKWGMVMMLFPIFINTITV